MFGATSKHGQASVLVLYFTFGLHFSIKLWERARVPLGVLTDWWYFLENATSVLDKVVVLFITVHDTVRDMCTMSAPRFRNDVSKFLRTMYMILSGSTPLLVLRWYECNLSAHVGTGIQQFQSTVLRVGPVSQIRHRAQLYREQTMSFTLLPRPLPQDNINSCWPKYHDHQR